MADCPICTEAFTEATRKVVKCPYCQYDCCTKCLKTYILSNISNPNCMNCHVEFNREFLDMHLTANFRTKDYKLHREKILFEREKSMLTATMPFVEREMDKRRMEANVKLLNERKAEILKGVREIEIQITKLYTDWHNEAGDLPRHLLGGDAQVERRQFIKACVMEGCRGFLSTQWKCGVCDTKVCRECHEPKNEEEDEAHVCKPENVESAKLIAKETKPCPKCAAAILKVSGCSQMWCTQCHTTFDWNTGREVITTNVHNPHYFEWVRRNNNGVVPRNPGDNPCGMPGQLPNYTRFHDRMRRWRDDLEIITNVDNLYMAIRHMNDYNIVRVAPNVDVSVPNRDLRIKYLMNSLEEADMKKELQKREKTTDFAKAKSQVCEMLLQVGVELFNALMEAPNAKEAEKICEQIEAIVNHYNEAMQKVHQRFGSKAKGLLLKEKWGLYN